MLQHLLQENAAAVISTTTGSRLQSLAIMNILWAWCAHGTEERGITGSQ